MLDIQAPLQIVVPAGSTVSLLTTALLLGVRHGIDWDHLAAIADITSTVGDPGSGESAHAGPGRAAVPRAAQVGSTERDRDAPGNRRVYAVAGAGSVAMSRSRILGEQRRAIVLGTLYALGHASVVASLGAIALAFGALLPDWVDPIMGRIVGLTLVVLGVWVFHSLYAHLRHGTEFRLRSRWMLVFSSIRYGGRWLRAKLHGHPRVEPVETSPYGPRTAFGVGMIHGVGAETGSQVLIIAAVGGAASVGLGIPMMLAFIAGLLISNTLIVLLTATGFVASRSRQRIYLAVGVVAGVFSLVVGTLFLLAAEDVLLDLDHVFGFIGGSA